MPTVHINNSTSTYYLTQSPVTIDATSVVNVASGDAVYGDFTQAWTVTNQGSLTGGTHGVMLYAGGEVDNAANATIEGGTIGVYMFENAGTVHNSGSITSGQSSLTTQTYGVLLVQGGTVTNSGSIIASGDDGVGVQIDGGKVSNFSGGDIGGEFAGVFSKNGGDIINAKNAQIVSRGKALAVYGAKTASVTNSGAFQGDVAVYLAGGGDVTNATGAAIYGTTVGTSQSVAEGVVLGLSGRVTNAGSIVAKGASAFGVLLGAGGTIVNSLGGQIVAKGGDGVEVKRGAGKIDDAGTISGTKHAIVFAGAGANTLILRTGAKIVGDIVGSTAKTPDEVAGAQSTGTTNALTLTGKGQLGAAVLHFQTLTVAKGAVWTLGAADAFGSIAINGGTLVAKAALSGEVTFSGVGELELTKAFGSHIAGLNKGDAIDFLATKFKSSDKVVAAGSNLWVETSAGVVLETLDLVGKYKSSDFKLGADAEGHIIVREITARRAASPAFALADTLSAGAAVGGAVAARTPDFAPSLALAAWDGQGGG